MAADQSESNVFEGCIDDLDDEYHDIISAVDVPEEYNGRREDTRGEEELGRLQVLYERLKRQRGEGPDTVLSRESTGDTTFTLLECAEMVVTPLVQSMSVLAWQPLRCCRGRTRRCVSALHFGLVVTIFMYDYIYNAVSCVQSPQCTGLVTKYTVPPLIHFSSFLSGAFYFRRLGGMDTSRGLIEAVFLQSTKSSAFATAYGDLSQQRLTRVLRMRLWWGVVWLAMRMVASGLSSLFAQREPLLPDASDLTNTLLSALKVVSGLACDGVYALTMTVFSIHCALLCFYIDGWRHRMAQRMHTLTTQKQQVLVIHRHIRNLNHGFGWPISLAFLQFSVEICLFAYNIIRLRRRDPEVYKVSLVLEFMTWFVILVFTLTQASYVTEKCMSIKAQGTKLRHEGYMKATREELDSFLIFLTGVRMEARVFGVRVSPSSRSVFLLAASLLILVLFRANVIPVSWF